MTLEMSKHIAKYKMKKKIRFDLSFRKGIAESR